MKLHFTLSLAVVVAFQTLTLRAQTNDEKLVVHEWGTFTSVQNGDGALVGWRPFRTAELPKFVHDWKHPGLPLNSVPWVFYGIKTAQVSLQRMETPVIYFYSDQERTVDVSVKFPRGLITEWYPQASTIGPSVVDTNKELAIFDFGQTKESLIRWSEVHVIPAKTYPYLAHALPTDTAGQHYFAARQTDSEFLRVDVESDTAREANQAAMLSCSGVPAPAETGRPEFEKCLFYRGVGNFATPLKVSMKSDHTVTIANTGKETLANLFILGIESKAGNYVHVAQLKGGEEKTVVVNGSSAPLDSATLSKNIADEMSQALVKSGLYQREADAMVNTWRDSWFAEDGTRVLYVLPQTWTEETLPMTLKPAPKELVRVMVGRAEVLAPGVEKALTLQLQRATHGDAAASQSARASLKKLGRFAEPALNQALAAAKLQPQEETRLSSLLSEVQGAN